MTSSYRRQKKSVQQKTKQRKQRLNAKEVLSATGVRWKISLLRREILLGVPRPILMQFSNRSLCSIIGLVLMSMLIYEKCDIGS